MRILHLCPKVPWPPEDGGRVAMRTLALSLLRAGADVRTLSMNPLKHRVALASLPEEARPLRVEAVDVDTSVTLFGALRSLASGTSFHVDRMTSAPFQRLVRDVARAEPPDAVLLESVFLLPCVPVLREETSAPLVLRSHNVEHEIWEGLARGDRRGLRRLYLTHLARRLRAWEVASLNVPDAIVPVSVEDAEAYRRLGATVPIHVSPVGLDAERCPDLSGSGDPSTLVFLGALDWRPNLEAVRWFLGEAWPIVRRAVPHARLLVAGSNPPSGLGDAFGGEGVRFLGRVPDAGAFLASGAAMVVPLLAGGGMRVKILEAMGLGVPVVSTRLGARGIEAADGREILLADAPESLAEACSSLLADRGRAAAIGRAGRERILSLFDADGIASRLLNFLEGLAPGRTRR
jgi:glycosyltransferase involved in cell wall biosynthesis